MPHWAILTGEYPPQTGGVGDYTAQLAAGLAAAGDPVTVWAGPTAVGDKGRGVAVRRLPDSFGPRALVALDRALAEPPLPDRLLVQYVPQAFGWKAMNVPFITWLTTRAARRVPLWVMFHEVMAPIQRGQRLRHALVGRVTQWMARQLASAAQRSFVSIPAWGDLLRDLCPHAAPAQWLPVFSNIPTGREHIPVAARSGEAAWIGHFGTFGPVVADLLGPVLAELLRTAPARRALLVGRGGPEFRHLFVARHPQLGEQVEATGAVPAAEVAAHLVRCDVLLQPFADGASSRRTSLMAGLALGVPTVTNRGFLSEPCWGTGSPGVTVAPGGAAAGLEPAVESVLRLAPEQRAALGAQAAAWYHDCFALEQTIRRLRAGVDSAT